jgi:excisionase family DNA binding protein
MNAPNGQLLYTPRDAARVLAICERTLWGLTRDGEIRAVRVGRSIRYSGLDLAEYVERLRTGTATTNEDDQEQQSA